MADPPKYFIGLDCGTSSVGWAVTDEKYHLMRRRGKTMWGSRLFEEASTAAERRGFRSNRRRIAREERRTKLLQEIFSYEIAKVDPDFYIRLKQSFYLENDKKFNSEGVRSKYSLFNDDGYTDVDYYRNFPTVWHLRKALIEHDVEKLKTPKSGNRPDIRLYYLGIEHIIKHRGHFLRQGEIKNGAGDFSGVWNDFCAAAEKCGININVDSCDDVEAILGGDLSKSDKKSRLNAVMYGEQDRELFSGDAKQLSTLIVGGKSNLARLFGIESENDAAGSSIEFSKDSYEDKASDIDEFLQGADGASDLVAATKSIYDYIYLGSILKGHSSITDAMVSNYKQHNKDLSDIKKALRPFKSDYEYFFKTCSKPIPKDALKKTKMNFYAVYIGRAYSIDKNGRKKHISPMLATQEDVNKKLEELFTKDGIGGDLLKRAKNHELLPKQKGYAKGTIPQQLHHNELKVILQHLEEDYPSFSEDPYGDGVINSQKIERLHDFRIPYYCGPMKTKTSKMDKNGFCWAENINEVVYPWNFDRLVNKSDRANAFIRRMTNECTYLRGENVLPKDSLMYQKYMVLNELNNLKIDSQRIDQDTKMKIYNCGYLNHEDGIKQFTLSGLNKWAKSAGVVGKNQTISGISEGKALPRLSTDADFRRILGDNYRKEYGMPDLEKTVELIAILNNEPAMLADKINEILKCGEDRAKKLSMLKYKNWGRFSAKFLNGITSEINGAEKTIIDALQDTTNNLMELLGQKYGYADKIDEVNSAMRKKTNEEITYDMVDGLYCSPAVKRSVWQAIKVVQEVEKAMGYAPAKVFLEVTRGAEKGNKKVKLSRKKRLLEKYDNVIKNKDFQVILNDVNSAKAKLDRQEDRDLQSQKLYLYYQQGGRCAYCGEKIEISEINNSQYCDRDHIYPRSKTKDDSITRNLVLVHATENREKTDIYPIDSGIRAKMQPIWAAWCRAGMITKDKYNRLTRSEPLTADELAGFVSRQLVETGQSVKAIRDLLKQNMPGTEVVMVKASVAHDLRQFYGYKGDKGNGLEPMPEFIKIRELNNLHHAKDAYLNIVAGNVLNCTFTDNPYKYIKDHGEDLGDGKKRYNYTIRTNRIFRNKEKYVGGDGQEHDKPNVKAWDYGESIAIMSRAMKRNDVLVTRMLLERKGAISDQQIVGRADNAKGIIPIKKGLDPTKYGGYNGIKGAYFALIEMVGKKDKHERSLVQVPIYEAEFSDSYLRKIYPGSMVIIPKIRFYSLMRMDGALMRLTARTGDRLALIPALEMYVRGSDAAYLKRVLSVAAKAKKDNGYKVDPEKDKVNKSDNLKLYKVLVSKSCIFNNMPTISATVAKLAGSEGRFAAIDSVNDQCKLIANFMNAFSCSTARGDLSLVVDKASQVGVCMPSSVISNLDECILYPESTTGLYNGKPIDLLTVQPGEVEF